MKVIAYLVYILLLAFFVSLVPIFGKFGLKNVDSTLATTVRAFIVLVFLLLVALRQGKTDVSGVSGKAFLFITLSWLFYFMAVKEGRV